ncbi:hypothetical protein ACRE_055170 [Hapsidospora chrysogenum ATCC 11550]|uniref:Uncharacterized protein n=1 Tax=Hapsidospora chrysogenum (strain ATCC 11550 / CBS 779.69 / DSM 880 / IAM 14645 / JCM 23072 / IMI 49137) TaxID=857340 RepID=A0A086T309_HAPC1|nr:hypothetical protein ACRE_055170 [Hapsidospora chrysogenum ATCC 11550]
MTGGCVLCNATARPLRVAGNNYRIAKFRHRFSSIIDKGSRPKMPPSARLAAELAYGALS